MNPARSPTTPPPTATTRLLRSAPSSTSPSHSPAAVPIDLLSSPGSMAMMSTSNRKARLSATVVACVSCTLASVMTSARLKRPSGSTSSPAPASVPEPISMS